METYRELERFAEKFTEDPITECWDWLAAIDTPGYGRYKAKGRLMLAHRVVYAYMYGPIPESMEIDHMCHNRACVNPAHLQAVTRQEHVMFMITRDGTHNQAYKTHCPQGHPYDGDNVYHSLSSGRQCRACKQNYELYRRQR